MSAPTLQLRTEALVRFDDDRGALLKCWPRAVEGEVYLVELRPGHPRGHHLHRHGGEWFIPVQGQALLVVEDPASGARAELPLDGLRVRVEAGQAHALYAVDGPALVLAVADKAHPDEGTEPWPVRPPAALATGPST